MRSSGLAVFAGGALFTAEAGSVILCPAGRDAGCNMEVARGNAPARVMSGWSSPESAHCMCALFFCASETCARLSRTSYGHVRPKHGRRRERRKSMCRNTVARHPRSHAAVWRTTSCMSQPHTHRRHHDSHDEGATGHACATPSRDRRRTRIDAGSTITIRPDRALRATRTRLRARHRVPARPRPRGERRWRIGGRQAVGGAAWRSLGVSWAAAWGGLTGRPARGVCRAASGRTKAASPGLARSGRRHDGTYARDSPAG